MCFYKFFVRFCGYAIDYPFKESKEFNLRRIMKKTISFLFLVISLVLCAETDVPIWGVWTEDAYYLYTYELTVNRKFGTFYFDMYVAEWFADGVLIARNNGYEGYVNGDVLKVYYTNSSRFCIHFRYTLCPDTRFCQPAACGHGCRIHQGGSDTCVLTTCSTCGTSYCKTHQKHACKNWTCCQGKTHLLKATVGATETLPDLSTLGKNEICPYCGEMRCTICGHTCKGPLNNNPVTIVPGVNCPSSELGCSQQICVVCFTKYCTVHGVLPNVHTCSRCGLPECAHKPHGADCATTAIMSNNSTTANTITAASNSLTQLQNTNSSILQAINQLIANQVQSTQAASANTLAMNNQLQLLLNQMQINANNQYTNNLTNQLALSGIQQGVSGLQNTASTIAAGVTNAAAAAQAAADKIPDQVDSVTCKDAMEELPDRSGVFSELKSKLMPSFSFFTISGEEYPSWTFTFPVSSLSPGMSDITFNVGGSAWSTVADGKLLWLMSITRAVSYIVFTFCFIFSVIEALRQW